MNKKINKKNLELNKTKYDILDQSFYKEISSIIYDSRKRIYNNIDTELVMTNWKIGKMIDEKQKSLPRAEYGEKLIEELSIQMTKDFGVGYSQRNLRLMRLFFLELIRFGNHCLPN